MSKLNNARGYFCLKGIPLQLFPSVGTYPFSAGLRVLEPESPPKEALVAAETFGVCLNGFKSRSMDHDMIKSSAMIIAMETKHLRILRGCFPQLKKCFLLPLFEKNVMKQEGT